ncbi:MAG: hypothetical protein PHF47_03295 [Bacilli bacterium]|nr:hypothetical protein [Bacilli bacterium]
MIGNKSTNNGFKMKFITSLFLVAITLESIVPFVLQKRHSFFQAFFPISPSRYEQIIEHKKATAYQNIINNKKNLTEEEKKCFLDIVRTLKEKLPHQPMPYLEKSLMLFSVELARADDSRLDGQDGKCIMRDNLNLLLINKDRANDEIMATRAHELSHLIMSLRGKNNFGSSLNEGIASFFDVYIYNYRKDNDYSNYKRPRIVMQILIESLGFEKVLNYASNKNISGLTEEMGLIMGSNEKAIQLIKNMDLLLTLDKDQSDNRNISKFNEQLKIAFNSLIEFIEASKIKQIDNGIYMNNEDLFLGELNYIYYLLNSQVYGYKDIDIRQMKKTILTHYANKNDLSTHWVDNNMRVFNEIYERKYPFPLLQNEKGELLIINKMDNTIIKTINLDAPTKEPSFNR